MIRGALILMSTGPEERDLARLRVHHQHHQRRGGVQHEGREGEQAGEEQDWVLQAVCLVSLRQLPGRGTGLRHSESVQCRWVAWLQLTVCRVVCQVGRGLSPSTGTRTGPSPSPASSSTTRPPTAPWWTGSTWTVSRRTSRLKLEIRLSFLESLNLFSLILLNLSLCFSITVLGLKKQVFEARYGVSSPQLFVKMWFNVTAPFTSLCRNIQFSQFENRRKTFQ